jgi:hypothetical protein
MDPHRVRPAPTGDPRVDAVVAGLASLDDVDLAERPAVLEGVHDRRASPAVPANQGGQATSVSLTPTLGRARQVPGSGARMADGDGPRP